MGGVVLPITTQSGVEAAALQNLAEARRACFFAKRLGVRARLRRFGEGRKEIAVTIRRLIFSKR